MFSPPRELTFGPPYVYPLKAALTRARSLVWRARRKAAAPSGLRILFYHRVTPDPDVLSVTPRRFAEQMQLLAASGYRVVSLDDAVDLLESGNGGLGRVVCVNFDDGYRDVAEHAAPVLREHGFCATVFAIPDVIDGRASLTCYDRQPPLLAWDEIAALDREGTLRFEAHTMTHPNLLALDDAEARHEIASSKATLEARLGRAV